MEVVAAAAATGRWLVLVFPGVGLAIANSHQHLLHCPPSFGVSLGSERQHIDCVGISQVGGEHGLDVDLEAFEELVAHLAAGASMHSQY